MASVIGLKRFRVVLIIGLCFFLLGCEPSVRTRPVGYLRLGDIHEILNGRDLSPFWLHVLQDDGGIYIISTLCTKDLEPLIESSGSSVRYSCPHCHSTYDAEGRVLSGPAVAALPHYAIQINQGVYGGAMDTLYAHVGVEVPTEWRLKLK